MGKWGTKLGRSPVIRVLRGSEHESAAEIISALTRSLTCAFQPFEERVLDSQ